jgi:dGTP triphosphohydrolase
MTGPRFILRDRLAREAEESLRLAPAAMRSAASRGRARAEPADPLRTAFERDRDRIMHSKAFRRLKHKTQVFVNPEDHYVTRLTHTIQVTQIARAIAAALSLNEALAEAVALGHDVGHSPFGHTGEEALSPYFPTSGGWHHAAQSVRVFEVLEDLNLSWEVRDGIRAHSWKIEPPPATQEALCVRYADRIAYLTHDALDALRAGLLTQADFPAGMTARFGPPGSPWIGGMIDAVIEGALALGEVRMRDDVLADMHALRRFMFERVYLAPSQRRHQQQAIEIIRRLMDHHLAHPEDLPASYRDNGADRVTQAADHVAGMTDRFALRTHQRLFGHSGMEDAVL